MNDRNDNIIMTDSLERILLQAELERQATIALGVRRATEYIKAKISGLVSRPVAEPQADASAA